MTEERFNELLKKYPEHDKRILIISDKENKEFEDMWIKKYNECILIEHNLINE